MSALSDVLVLASLSAWLHVGACVALPLAWGVATEIVFRLIAKRRAPVPGARDGSPSNPDRHFVIDYHI